ncbi:MAG: AarF/UbiB family protein, partial [Planctomycetota bacterium]
LIANRPDLFPLPMVEEFAHLENRVKPVPFSLLRGVLEEELGSDPGQVFASIEETPIASASVAQIHLATLHDGSEVILKIQKPGIQRVIDSDLEILGLLAEALARSDELRTLDPEGLVAEVRRALDRELNFNFERNAIERIRENFKEDPVLVVPRTYPQLSTRRLLVMQFLHGTSLRHHNPDIEEARRIARQCSRILFEMIFRDGYFHADPHPSNILVLKDGHLGWVDFGSMGLFTKEMRLRLLKLLRALLSRDYSLIARQIVKLGRSHEQIPLFEFSQDLASRLDPFFGLSLKQLDIVALFNTTYDLAREYRITVAPGFVLMTRCLVLMEGLAHRLDPDFNTVEELEPLARSYLMERFRPDQFAGEVVDGLLETLNSLWEYPQHLTEILRKLAEGRVQVDTEVKGLERLSKRIELSANRLVQALIVSSLLVSSSLVVGYDIGPKWGEVPLLGLAGYLFAGLIGLRILISMLKP